MAIAANFPSIKPSLNLDFANVGRLDPRVTFARASSGTYYDGVTTAKAEENLLLQSQTFNTTWTPQQVTISADTETAPDGTSTADSLLETAVTNIHAISQTSLSVSGTYTVSCFIKANGRDYAFLSLFASASSDAISVDLVAGTATSANGSPSNIFCTSVGNGWFRAGYTTTVSGTHNFNIYASTDGVWANRNYAGNASLGLYLWGAQLEQRSAVTAYTATTTQPITNYIPVLQTAAAGVARFDHTPTTGAALGLLIEEQRTNLFTYSEDFADAAWTKGNSTITSNTIVAPDGTLTADKHIPDSGATIGTGVTQTRITNGTKSFTGGASYTVSIYAKAGEFDSLKIGIIDSGGNKTLDYNLSTGVASVSSGTGATASMTSVGNGWWRCVTTWTHSTTESKDTRFTAADSVVTTGDGYSGVFIWGAQLEAGAFPTSYIPTTTATVTRAADAASMTGTNFSSWFNNAEGANYFDFNMAQGRASSAHIAGIGDASSNTASNRMQFALNSSDRLSYAVVSNGTTVVTGLSPTNTGPNYKIATVFKTDDYAAAVNSGTVSTDTSGASPIGLDRMTIGSNLGSTIYLNGTIRKIAYYPQRLTDAQLQALTG